MKLKLLSIFFVLLIVQAQVAQGSPLFGLDVGSLIGTATNIVSGAVNTVTNTVSAGVSLVGGAATNIVSGAVNTVTNTVNAGVSLLGGALTGVVQIVGNVATQATTQLNNAIGAGTQILAEGAKLITNAAGDVVSTVNTALTTAAAQALPLIETTLKPLTDFGATVTNIIANTTTLFSNPINNINQAISGLTTTLASANTFQPALNLISQGFAKVGETIQTVAGPIQNVIQNLALTIPTALSSGLNIVASAIGPANNILTAASDLTNALAAQISAGALSLTSSTIPITTALATQVNNIANGLNNVPATINNAINGLQNTANSLQAASNDAFQQATSALAAIGSSNGILGAIGNLAADVIGKSVSCVTNEISTLQHYLVQYQNLASQYQFATVINTLSTSTLQETIQTTANFTLYIPTVKFRIESCLAVGLLSATGSFIPHITSGVASTITQINNAIGAGFATGANLIANAAGDVVSTVNNALTNSAGQLLPLMENTLAPITGFGNTVSNIIANNTALLNNGVSNINQTINSLTSPLASADPIKPAFNLISQGIAKVGETVTNLAAPAQNVINNLAAKIPIALSTGLNTVTAATGPANNILTAASDLTKAIAAQGVAGTQSLSSSTLPITTALATQVNNIVNGVNNVPATINNAINALQNSANSLQTFSNDAYQQAASALAAVGSSNGVLSAAANLATDAIGKSVSCITNEISTLQNYLDQYQNLASQYQFATVINTLSTSTLQDTIKTTANYKLYLLSVKYRIESCLAARLLSTAGSFIPLVTSGVGSTTTQLNNAIGAGFADGANLIANAAGDPVSTVNTALSNSADQLLPLMENTLAPITGFGNTVFNIIANKTALLNNAISNIDKSINGLTSTIASADPIKPAFNLISQGVAKVGETRPTLAAPAQNIINNLASTIPAALSSGLNTIATATGPANNVLTAASDLTKAIAAQGVASTQFITNSTTPITTALATPVTNIINSVNNVPATINNAINGLQNTANSLQAANNAAYQQAATALAAFGSSNDVLSATANLATDSIGKSVSCVTNEIPTLQNYLAQYQNLAAQYKIATATNLLRASTLQQTIQTTANYKLYLPIVKYRIENCLAVNLLSTAGSFIPLITSVEGGSATQLNNAIAAGFADGANLIANAAGDAVPTVNIALTNSADQLLPLMENTLAPITGFGNTVSNIITNNTALLHNAISNIDKSINGLTSPLASADPIKPALNLISQGVAKVGATRPTLAVPAQNIINSLASTIPASLSTGLNALTAATSPANNVLTAASDLTKALTAPGVAGTQYLSSSTIPMTTALAAPINNIANAVNKVPATINNAIDGLQNTANSLQAANNDAYQQAASALAAAGSTNDVLSATTNIAADAIGNSVSCVTNEISTLQNYLAEYQNLDAQYQFATIINTLSTSTLQETIQTTANYKLYLPTVKYRIEICLAAKLLNAAGSFIPLVTSAAGSSTTPLNNAIAAGFTDGANLIENASGDPVSTVNTALTNSAGQLQPLMENTLAPIIGFGNTVSNLITNKPLPSTNAISNINQSITSLTSTLASADPIKPALNLISQGVAKVGETRPVLAAPVQDIISSLAATIPTALSSGLNTVTTATGPANNVLTATSDFTKALAAQGSAGTQYLSNSTIPITTALATPVNNLVSGVNNVPATINNAINALQNSANSLQAANNAAYQQAASALAAVGSSNDVLGAIANLAADSTKKSVACVTNEIPTLQNYLAQYQNLAAQYQAATATNSLKTSTLQNTIQTTANYKLYLPIVKYRIESCLAARLLNAAGSIIPLVPSNVGSLTSPLNNAIAAGFTDGANLIANAAGDPVSTVNTALTNSADQLLPLMETTLIPITGFGNTVSNIIANKTALLNNAISNINQSINGLTSTIASADPIKPALSLISQGVAKVGETRPTLAVPAQNIINNLASTIPTALSSGFTVATATGPANNVLTAASDLTKAIAAQGVASTQFVSNSAIPITTALATPVKNIVNGVNNVPATINNAINALQNTANSLQAANNDAYQQAASALATFGSSNDVLSATANLATDSIGKSVSCVTKEIPTLQNYLAQYQNLAAQYQVATATNSLRTSTLQQTIQTTANYKLYLPTMKYRIESCLAVGLLSTAGSIIPLITSVQGGSTTQLNNAIAAGFADGANLIANAAGDLGSTVNIALTNSADQLLPLMENTLAPITGFGNTVSNIIANNTALLNNAISNIDKSINGLTSPLAAADPIKPALNLISQGVAKVGATRPTLVVPAQNVINSLASTIPAALSSGLSSVATAIGPAYNVFTATSDLTKALAAPGVTGSQYLSSSTIPMTTTLATPINNIANAVNKVPATINNAINALQNSANSLQAANNDAYQQAASALAAVGSSNDVLSATANIAADSIGNSVSCVTNEITTLQNYLADYQNLGAQYQFATIINTLSTSTLQETIQTTANYKLYLPTVKYRIEICLAARLINAAGSIIPLVTSVTGGSTTQLNNAIAAGFTDGANLIANAAGDPVSTVNTALTNSGNQLQPLMENTLAPITGFGNTVSNLIANKTLLSNNAISNINQSITSLTSTFASADPIKPALNLISQGVAKVGENRPTLAVPAQNIINSLTSTIPAALSPGLTTVATATGPANTVLTAASDLTKALAAQGVAGSQFVPNSAIPITTALATPVNNLANGVNNVPATINNAINGLQNSANSLQAANNAAYQQAASALAAVGVSNDVLSATANLAADSTKKSVACVTNEITTLQNYLAQYQDLAAQYQTATATNSLKTSTLQQTVQTTVNYKLYLPIVKYRIESCLAARLLSTAGSFIPLVPSGAGVPTSPLNNAIAAGIADGANLIANAAGDPVSTVNTALSNSANQLLPLMENTLIPITGFGSTVSNIIANKTALLNNAISNINQSINGLTSTIVSADPIKPALNLISQGVAKVGATRPTLAVPAQNVINNLASTIPTALSPGFTAVATATGPANNVLTAASDLTKAIAAPGAAGTQFVSNSAIPISTALATTVNNIVNAVNNVPATINNAINALQNSANSLQAANNAAYQQAASALAANGTSNDVLSATANLAADSTGKSVSCVTNEITTLQNYLAQYQNLASQYQIATATNSLRTSTLQQTIQTTANYKLYLPIVKYRIESCLAARLLSTAGSFIPLVTSVAGGSTSQLNNAIAAGFADGANQIANAAGDPVSTVNTALTNSANQLLPLLENTLAPLTGFGSTVPNIIANNTALLNNAISDINQSINGLTSTIVSADPIKPALNLISQGVAKVGETRPTLAAPAQNVINSLASTIPAALSSGLNAIATAGSPANNVLTAASDLTKAFAAQGVAGTQYLSSSTIPIITALATPVNNLVNGVNNVPATINNAINALQNSANKLQTANNDAFQQAASALTAAGSSTSVLSAAANLAADSTGKSVACVTNEITTLQNFLADYQNLAAQYQFATIINSLGTATLQDTIQTTANYKLYLPTVKYRIENCIAANLLSAAGSFIPLVTSVPGGSTSQLNNAIAAGFADGANLIANAAGDPVSTVNTALTNSADQLLPLMENTLTPITGFGNTVSNIIANKTALLNNAIGNINQSINGLTSPLASADPIKPALNLISQGVAKVGETRPTLAAPAQTVINNLASTIPTALSSGLSSVATATGPANNVLTAASDLTKAIAAPGVAGTQFVSNSAIPITTALATPVNNIVNAVNNIPATINNAINGLQNSANSLQAANNAAYQQAASALAAVGSSNGVLSAADKLAADSIGKSVSCVTNEITTLQKYLAQYQDLAAQYQTATATNSLQTSTLQQTVQTTVNYKLYLPIVKYRIESCLAARLLSTAGSFIPLVTSVTGGSTSPLNNAIAAGFADGANLIANAAGDPVSTVNTALTNSAAQLLPLMETTLIPITGFGNTVPNIIANKTALLNNAIGNINQSITGLTSTIVSADPIKPALNLISQGVAKVGETRPTLAAPAQTVINNLASTIPAALSTGLNAVATATGPANDVLTTASDLTKAIAAQGDAGTQFVSSSAIPITTALAAPINNIVNSVNNVPATINNAINALQNSANSLQAANNNAYQQAASALAAVGSSNDVLSAADKLAADSTGKSVACVTNEITTLQNYLAQYQNLASQYQIATTTNSLKTSTLQQTVQTTANYKLYLPILKYRIESCLAARLLSTAGSFIPLVTSVTGGSTPQLNNAIAAGFADGANLIANAAGDPVSTVNTALTNSAAQILPLMENTLAPITGFGNTVSSIIANNTALLNNGISNINQSINGLTSTLPSADLIKPALNLISQGVAKVGETRPALAVPAQNVINKLASTIPTALSPGLNAVATATGPANNVLTAASDLTKALAAQGVAGAQYLSSPTIPITTALATPVNNIANGVNNVPATINNAINALQNSANSLQAANNDAYQQAASALAAVGSSTDVLTATATIAADSTGKSVSCVTNEISTLQKFLADYQNLGAQYQFASVINTLSTSTLQDTIKTTANYKLYLLTVKYRIESCLAARLLSTAGSIIPIVTSVAGGSTSPLNNAIAAGFVDGANLIANAAGDAASTVNTVLSNSAAQLIPLIANTLAPITGFGNTVPNLIANKTALLNNGISNINQTINGLTSTLTSADPIKPALNLISQGVAKVGQTMPTLVAAAQNIINNLGSTIPTALSFGLNTVATATDPANNVLTAASDLTKALAAQDPAGTQFLTGSNIPITTALATPVNNIVNAVNNVPATISNAINALQNSANSLQAGNNAAYQQAASALAAVGSSNDVLSATANSASYATGNAVSCVTKEISTLQNYLAQYQKLAAQNQLAIATNSLSGSALQDTIQTTVNYKLYIPTVKFRIEGCVAARLLSAAGSFVPLVTFRPGGSCVV